jgi:hypothetical protein
MNCFRSLECWNHGFESHSKHGCLCVRLFCVCFVLCVGSGIATGWSLVQEVQGPTKSCRAINEWMKIVNLEGRIDSDLQRELNDSSARRLHRATETVEQKSQPGQMSLWLKIRTWTLSCRKLLTTAPRRLVYTFSKKILYIFMQPENIIIPGWLWITSYKMSVCCGHLTPSRCTITQQWHNQNYEPVGESPPYSM